MTERCAACGSPVLAGAAFCQSCGSRVSAAPIAAADAIRSERKFVTVLFADVKGSLELIAGQDPEQVDDVLSAVIDKMRDAVRRFGGIVSQMLGDGVMALFGAPRAAEDHAARACLAALAIRSTIGVALPQIRVRIGLNSGEVVVRAMLDDATAHYGAVGETVHVAARMEQAAAPDQILLTAETARFVDELVELRPLGLMAVKGLDQAVQAFELLRVLPRREARRSRAGGPAPLVGREADLAVLLLARDEAAAGRGRVIRVVGSAGCGKSRLVREFLASLPPQEWLVCYAEALPHRQTSYGIVIMLLTALFGFEAGDSLEIRRGKLQAHLAALAGGETPLLAPPLASLLELGVTDAEWHGLESWERRERTVHAACELLRRASRGRRAAAVIVEDAHWLDAESARLFERLAALSVGDRLLKVVTERAEQGLRWTETGLWTVCHLGALDEAAARRLLRLHLLPGPGVAALEERLIEHTRGNPLFIEECLYALAEAGELTRTASDQFQLVGAVPILRVPKSLRGLLDARVDHLPEADKDVLQAAAVVGTVIPLGLLGVVAGRDAAALHPVISRLCRDGFLLADPGDPARFSFRHGLTREAVYNSILKRTRSRLHAAVFGALEGQADPAAEAVDMLADHAFRAEIWPKAVQYARQAAARAAARDANADAARSYEQALTAASHWPAGADKDRMLLTLHLEARTPLFRLGDVAGLRMHVDEAIALAERQGIGDQLGNCHVFRSHAIWLAGDTAGALQAAQVISGIAAAQSDGDLRIRGRYQEGLVYLSQSRTADTLASMGEVLAHIAAGGHGGRYGLGEALAVTAHSYMARAFAEAGDGASADAAVAQARASAQRHGKRFYWIFPDLAEGYVALLRGRADLAMAPLERAVETCQAADARLLGPVPASYLAWARVATGRAAEGAALARQAVEDAARMGFMTGQPLRLAILARAQLAAGAIEEADRCARDGEDLARRIGEPGAELYAVQQRGEVCLAMGRVEDGRALLTAAQARAAALGLQPLAAACGAALGGGGSPDPAGA